VQPVLEQPYDTDARDRCIDGEIGASASLHTSRRPMALASATKTFESPRSAAIVSLLRTGRADHTSLSIIPATPICASSGEGNGIMTSIDQSGTFTVGDRMVNRLGYGAMQLAGPGVFGPPKDRVAALAVLREAVAGGVNHIDTSDYYGPHVTNRLIREALHPYSDDLVIVTKIGARRGEDRSWLPAFSPEELTQAVHDNLRNLGLDVLEVVNLRIMFDAQGPAEGSIEAPLSVLAELQRQGLVRHIGLSNVTPGQIAEGRRICEIVCVQNHYNLAHRADEVLIDDLASDGIAYVPFFPLGGFTPLQSSTLSNVAQRLGATPMQVVLAWLLRRAPNILLIPGTSSIAHLRENLAAAELNLPGDALRELDCMR
jgi:pyridoxine 4-dehydrogenase